VEEHHQALWRIFQAEQQAPGWIDGAVMDALARERRLRVGNRDVEAVELWRRRSPPTGQASPST
jgi:hypothetical protein